MPDQTPQKPCLSCRHSGLCGDDARCHAFRVFALTGRKITPPCLPPGGMKQAMQSAELTRLEQLASETGNNAFAWRAVMLCERPGELPEWAWDYLRECGENILSIDPGSGRLPHDFLEALGFSRNGGGPTLLACAESAIRRKKALDYIIKRVPVIGVTEAAREAAELFEFKAGTLRQYYYRNQSVNSPAEFNLQTDDSLCSGQ